MRRRGGGESLFALPIDDNRREHDVRLQPKVLPIVDDDIDEPHHMFQ
ncbi:hypothetical protein [Chloroflexus sp.]